MIILFYCIICDFDQSRFWSVQILISPDFDQFRFWSVQILISPDFDQSRFWSHIVSLLCAGVLKLYYNGANLPFPLLFLHRHFSHTQCSWLCPPLSLVQWSRRIQRKTCTDERLLQFPRASHHTRSWEGRPPPGKDFISKSQQGWFDWQMIDSIVRCYPTTYTSSIQPQNSDFLVLFDCEEKKEENQKASQEGFRTTTVMSQAPEPPKQKHKQTNKQTNKQTVTMSQHHKPCLWFVSTWVQGRCKIWYDMASKTHGATYAPRWHHGALYHVQNTIWNFSLRVCDNI